MYLCSFALIFYIDWDFSLGHISMDLSSVLTALSFHGVPSLTRTNIQVASPQGCTPGLADPEPSSTFIHPGRTYRTIMLSRNMQGKQIMCQGMKICFVLRSTTELLSPRPVHLRQPSPLQLLFH